MASMHLTEGMAVAYVVGGVVAFSGTLAYVRGDWAGIADERGHVDEVLVDFVRPA